MALYELDGKAPQLGKNVWIAESAHVMGGVELGDDVSVWFGAVIRGDTEVIRIGHRSNVQDGSVLHEGVTIGKRCVLGHQVLVHETTLGDGVQDIWHVAVDFAPRPKGVKFQGSAQGR